MSLAAPAGTVCTPSSDIKGAKAATTLDAIRSKMPSNNSSKAGRVEAKYDVVLDFPNLELHSAAASGNVGLVHYALTHGQPVNSLLHGCLPLHAASSGGSVAVVRMLIERGADVNAPRLPRRYSDHKNNKNAPAVGTAGSTPLHFAAANGHADVVQLLLACGAVPNKQDKNGLTPEDLAEMSGHPEVIRAIRVWCQINSYGPSLSDTSPEAGPSRHRPRAHSLAASSTMTGSEQSDGAPPSVTPSSAKGKERTSSVVSVASEKGLRLLRNSLESGWRNRAPALTTPTHKSGSDTTATARNGSSASTPSATPPTLSLTITSTVDSSDVTSPTLTSPFANSPVSPLDDDSALNTGSIDSPDPNMPGNARSSRRPSLPSIIEKAAQSGAALRTAIRKHDGGPSPQLPQSAPLSGPSSLFRGRSLRSERPKVNKQAILGLFRRGQSPHSRSPSPPRTTEPKRVMASEQVDEEIARLKRASATSMGADPEMMELAMATSRLGDHLEKTATSAPVTKSRFFESNPPSPSHSLSSERVGPAMPPPPPVDRPWDRYPPRSGTSSGVISPSPLSNEWNNSDSDEPTSGSRNPPRATVRRTLTEIRRPHHHPGPRRMPSAPSMPSYPNRSWQTLPPLGSRRVVSASSGEGSPVPQSSETEGVETPHVEPEEDDDDNDRTVTELRPGIDYLEEGDRTITSDWEEVTSNGHFKAATPSTPSIEEPDSQVETLSSADITSLQLDTPESELTSSTELRELAEVDSQQRVRGDSNATVSSRGAVTPPSCQVLTPPGSGDASGDTRSLGMSSPPSTVMAPRSRRPSESSSAIGAIAAAFPPVPEHQVADTHRSPLVRQSSRKISSHAEARDIMEQSERDILELAQLPDTADSSRSLADQLAAYGDSHAAVREFARVERDNRLSSLSSGSSQGGGGDGSKRRSLPSNRSSRLSTSPTLPPVPSAPGPIDRSVDRIYDRRTSAYRERLQTLSSMPQTTGMQRAMSTPRSRATSHGDAWRTIVPTASTYPRRLTDPTGSAPSSAGNSPVDTKPESRPPWFVMSGPDAPDLRHKRSSLANGRTPQVANGMPFAPASAPGTGVLNSRAPSFISVATAPRPHPTSGGLARASSLNRTPRDGKHRYHGLSQRQHGPGSGMHMSHASHVSHASSLPSRVPLRGREHESDDSPDDYTTIDLGNGTRNLGPGHAHTYIDRAARAAEWRAQSTSAFGDDDSPTSAGRWARGQLGQLGGHIKGAGANMHLQRAGTTIRGASSTLRDVAGSKLVGAGGHIKEASGSLRDAIGNLRR